MAKPLVLPALYEEAIPDILRSEESDLSSVFQFYGPYSAASYTNQFKS
jgi:hypothetical protein